MTRFCKVYFIFLLFQLSRSLELSDDNSFDACLRKDSISCVQIHVYRKLRSFFNQDAIDLFGGFRLVKNNVSDEGRSSRTDVDEQVFGANGIAEREIALEDFAYEKITNFFNERSFKWSITPMINQVSSTARMALANVPQDIKERVTSYITEGRSKKKILKSLIPVLIAAKLKIIGFLGLVYVTTAVIAKKALISSVLALAIILFITFKKHLSKHYIPLHHEVHAEPYHGHGWSHPISDRWSGSSGWDPSYNSYDIHGSHSSPHHVAYSGQKPAHR